MNRNSQQPSRPAVNGSAGSVTTPSPVKKSPEKSDIDPMHSSKWYRSTAVIFLFAVTILVAAAVAILGFTNTVNPGKYVNKDDMQAVFVNVNGTTGGQVYFGHIQDINSSYVRLTGVFFIQQSDSSTSATSKTNSSSLVLQKLGCQQIHDPEDQMIINKDQVLFWENISNDGQVAKQAATYYKNNPNGTCDATASSDTSNSTSDTSTTNGSSNDATTNDKSATDKTANTNTGTTGTAKQ